MTLDDCLKLIPVLLEEVREVRAENREIKAMLTENAHGLDMPVYDIDGLMGMGYSKHEGYRILRSRGSKGQGGRLRVTRQRLLEYQEARPN